VPADASPIPVPELVDVTPMVTPGVCCMYFPAQLCMSGSSRLLPVSVSDTGAEAAGPVRSGPLLAATLPHAAVSPSKLAASTAIAGIRPFPAIVPTLLA
jgi:hypothetical protein